MWGNQSVRTGKPTINATLIPSEIKNGITPLKVSIIGTSFAKELITKTFSPTGGVISPTSTTIRVITPNHSFKSSAQPMCWHSRPDFYECL